MSEPPWSGRRLHFVGIGGAGMSGLAIVARALGAQVTGSDSHRCKRVDREEHQFDILHIDLEDVGNVASLFCSQQAEWITGQLVYADGGASLMNPEVPPEIQLG